MEYIIGKLLQHFEQGKMTLTATAASTVGTEEAAAPANATYIMAGDAEANG